MSEDEVRATLANPRNAPDKLKTVEQGAATSVRCATTARLDGLGGVYGEDVDIAAPAANDASAERGVWPWAMDRDAAERLWTKSEEWTGAVFST